MTEAERKARVKDGGWTKVLWLNLEGVDRLASYVKKSKAHTIHRVQLLEGAYNLYLVEYS
jgi:hypothetical protein